MFAGYKVSDTSRHQPPLNEAMIIPVIIGKLVGGVSAILVALYCEEYGAPAVD
ncbi:MAG: hypothetical protein FD169_2362 [Bacillota bacterium]|nr:MAG: hypothetical protein FD169_2362 [Bacillota bacterium]